MPRPFVPVLIVPVLALAAAAAQPAHRSTQDGVYTLAQANQGKDLFAGYCQSCHTPTVHAGPPFRNKWFGRTLGELFGYMRREMPKTDPGSLGDEEYATLLAYLMRINGMPTGSTPLAADSAALHRIRIDSLPRSSAAPTSPDHRR
ncbi:MAG: cytochrome c [Gemmatimonadota bacterium]|nr:cytochrome c [Gemmatimonadota bacterium]